MSQSSCVVLNQTESCYRVALCDWANNWEKKYYGEALGTLAGVEDFSETGPKHFFILCVIYLTNNCFRYVFLLLLWRTYAPFPLSHVKVTMDTYITSVTDMMIDILWLCIIVRVRFAA